MKINKIFKFNSNGFSLSQKKKIRFNTASTRGTLRVVFIGQFSFNEFFGNHSRPFVTPSPRRSWIIQLPANRRAVYPREKHSRILAFLETLLLPTLGIPRSRNTLLGKCDAFCIWMPATWNYPAVSLPFFEHLLPFHAPGNFGEDRFSPGASISANAEKFCLQGNTTVLE